MAGENQLMLRTDASGRTIICGSLKMLHFEHFLIFVLTLLIVFNLIVC